MFILFVGDTRYNLGPCNVNKEIIRHKSEQILAVDFSRRYYKALDLVMKMMKSKVTVVSGVSKFNSLAIRLSKLFRRKTVYIMHGCVEHESKIDGKPRSEEGLRLERELLESVDLILPVSRRYSEHVKKWYPQYEDKIHYWQVGVHELPADICVVEKQKNSLAAAGGDWLLKQNHVVSCAVEHLNGAATFTVFGPVEEKTVRNKNRNTHWMGSVDHDVFMDALRTKELFVVNSVIESFNISVMEALGCGCSVLISDHVGAADIMELTDRDVIVNTNDEEEIAEKIAYLLEHPNNHRIREAMNWPDLSYDAAVKRLEKICEQLAARR